ncbi:MAG: hypothetical protein RRE78_05860, partial [Acidianus sp.]|nr:hypothetical protein [Acidianus sp.]
MGVETSYVSNNGQFYANTVEDYNNYDDATNCDHFGVCSGNKNIGINVGGYTYLPSGFPIFMYEYGWVSVGAGCKGPGCSSGYYVGILQYNSTKGLGYFLTTSYNNIPCSSNLCTSGYYDYYYSGSGWSFGIPNWNLNYYFLEDNTGNTNNGYSGSNYFAFMPLDQQSNQENYSQYGVFWLYNWFQEESGNMNIFFLMNGNIFNYPLASVPYTVDGLQTYAIPPNPPASTINGEPIFAQSYINAYNTAFNQPNNNYQKALNNYNGFNSNDVNNNFVPGTFGYDEEYNGQRSNLGNGITINYLKDNAKVYSGVPCLFISAGSGGGSGYMYLDW